MCEKDGIQKKIEQHKDAAAGDGTALKCDCRRCRGQAQQCKCQFSMKYKKRHQLRMQKTNDRHQKIGEQHIRSGMSGVACPHTSYQKAREAAKIDRRSDGEQAKQCRMLKYRQYVKSIPTKIPTKNNRGGLQRRCAKNTMRMMEEAGEEETQRIRWEGQEWQPRVTARQQMSSY